MVSSQYPAASWFLVVVNVFFLAVYALPLLLFPLQWARWFGWVLPEGSRDLTVYFGRCLGGVALAIIATLVRCVPEPERHPLLFDLVAMVCGLMTVIHIAGALRRVQPWIEDAEIVLYAAVAVAACWIRITGLS